MVSSQPLNRTHVQRKWWESHFCGHSDDYHKETSVCVSEREKGSVCVCVYVIIVCLIRLMTVMQLHKNPEEGMRQRKINPREEELRERKRFNRTEWRRKAAVRNEGMDGASGQRGGKQTKQWFLRLVLGGKIQSTWSNSICKNWKMHLCRGLRGGEWLPISLQHTRINEADKWLFSGHPDLATLSYLHHIS